MMRARTLALTCSLIALSLTGCDTEKTVADTVFLNATVYTANETRDMATAFALKDGAFIYVGDDANASNYIGANTNVVRLSGELVLPGLHDNHLHPHGIIEFDRCDLESASLNLSELSNFIADCVKRLKPEAGAWLVGEQWAFSKGNTPTTEFATIRQALDAASIDIPIVLSGNDGHHSAFNSAGLALAQTKDGRVIGINKATLKNEFKEYKVNIGQDADGNADGMVNEQARALMMAPSLLEGDINKIVEHAAQIPERLNSIGITSMRDAAFMNSFTPMYDKIAQSDKQSLRITLSQYYNPLEYRDTSGEVNWDAISKQAADIKVHFAPYANIRADSMKIFMDGVAEGNPLSDPPALPNAAKITPYKQPIFNFDTKLGALHIKGYVDPQSDACKDDKPNSDAFKSKYGFYPEQCTVSKGVLESPRDIELEFIRRFDAEGYSLHLHAIGDRAVRTALDGLENARTLNGPTDKPHALAHIQFVHPDDIKRIGALKLYLAYTYAWMLTDPEYDLSVMPFIDEIKDADDLYRQEYSSYTQAYPVKSTMDAGAILIAGSDAPVETRDPRPFVNMQQAVTRAGTSGLPYNSAEKVSILDVIDSYTINGAKAMDQSESVGSFEVGKRGDFIILDQNIIILAKEAPTKIGTTIVKSTWFDGAVVYEDK